MVKKEKKTSGRPTVMTKEVLGKLDDAFNVGANDRQACLYAGINPDTLYEYQKKHPEYAERKSMLKERPVLKAKWTVYKNLDDPKLAMEYLKCKDDTFSTRVKQEVTNTTPQIVVASQADADLLKKISDVKPD